MRVRYRAREVVGWNQMRKRWMEYQNCEKTIYTRTSDPLPSYTKVLRVQLHNADIRISYTTPYTKMVPSVAIENSV